MPKRNYAVIVDEAHSSQTGQAAKDLRSALSKAKEPKPEELSAAEKEAKFYREQTGNPAYVEEQLA